MFTDELWSDLKAILLEDIVYNKLEYRQTFSVFFVYVFYNTHGLESDVPESVSVLVNRPLSFNLLGAMAFFGLIILFFVTTSFPKEVDLENNRPNAYISLLYLYVSVL